MSRNTENTVLFRVHERSLHSPTLTYRRWIKVSAAAQNCNDADFRRTNHCCDAQISFYTFSCISAGFYWCEVNNKFDIQVSRGNKVSAVVNIIADVVFRCKGVCWSSFSSYKAFEKITGWNQTGFNTSYDWTSPNLQSQERCFWEIFQKKIHDSSSQQDASD